MDFKCSVLVILICLTVFIRKSGSSGHYKEKKIILHIPVQVKHHKHVHTIVKHIHYHHKPIVIKDEKIAKEPIHIKEEAEHEHYHHHYKHEHPDAQHEINEGHHFEPTEEENSFHESE